MTAAVGGRCDEFAARIPNVDGTLEGLLEEGGEEDEEGGVGLAAVGASMVARWLEMEHGAAVSCAEAMAQRKAVASQMLLLADDAAAAATADGSE